MLKQIQNEIDQKKNEIKNLNDTISEIYADTNLIRPKPEPIIQGSKQCPKRCERWDGGNLSCRHHCGIDHFRTNDRNNELRRNEIAKHITPLVRNKEKIQQEIKNLELKSTLPYLRNELLSNVSEFETLEKTDPQFRQKQIDLKKSIFEQSAEVDKLENQFNWFGNIPTMKPKIITPDPVVRTTTELGPINTRPLLIGVIVGLAALFLIWRFK